MSHVSSPIISHRTGVTDAEHRLYIMDTQFVRACGDPPDAEMPETILAPNAKNRQQETQVEQFKSKIVLLKRLACDSS